MSIYQRGQLTMGDVLPGATKMLARMPTTPAATWTLTNPFKSVASPIAASAAPVVQAPAFVRAPAPVEEEGIPRAALIAGGVVGVLALAAVAYKVTR